MHCVLSRFFDRWLNKAGLRNHGFQWEFPLIILQHVHSGRNTAISFLKPLQSILKFCCFHISFPENRYVWNWKGANFRAVLLTFVTMTQYIHCVPIQSDEDTCYYFITRYLHNITFWIMRTPDNLWIATSYVKYPELFGCFGWQSFQFYDSSHNNVLITSTSWCTLINLINCIYKRIYKFINAYINL